MHLPKGSILIPNVWHMLHDPAAFPNPMKFDPDRYQNLDSEMDKVTDPFFGFGRRLCPGKAFAERTVFAIAATLLATCNVFPPVDENGKDIIPNITYSSGGIRRVFTTARLSLLIRFSSPSRFDCNIKPRSDHAYELLARSAVDAPDSSLVN
jgi:cytochrome P450